MGYFLTKYPCQSNEDVWLKTFQSFPGKNKRTIYIERKKHTSQQIDIVGSEDCKFPSVHLSTNHSV